ncbi:hypothetical protein [Saccharothrix sp. HUAS TT1]|uniref:hypothetical protein n=1 Tax=unclassified Saccharothrix TaxID=2593673 RepID=UPI00345BDB80
MSSRRVLPTAVALAGVVLLAGCGGASPASPPPSTTSSAVSAAPVALGDFVAIPRTQLSLRVPEGMAVNEDLPGLGQPGTRNSVVVMDLPMGGRDPKVALEDIAGGFSGSKAADRGMEMGEVRHLTIADRPAILTSGVQRVSGSTYTKAIAALAADDSVVMVTGTLEEDSSVTADELLEVLSGARWNGEAVVDDRRPDLTPAEGYQRRDAPGDSVLFTLGGEAGPGVPKLLAAQSLGQAPVAEDQRRSFAVARFEALPAKPSVGAATEVAIAGLPGWELTGEGDSGAVVYTAIVFDDDGYFVVAGDFDPAAHPDQLPAFREMARSLVRP